MATTDEDSAVSFIPNYRAVRLTPPTEDHLSRLGTAWAEFASQISGECNPGSDVITRHIVSTSVPGFFDFEMRREAVSETISAFQSQAENTQTRCYLPFGAFWALFKRPAQRGWNAIFEKLESFSTLSRAWDGYSARPPERTAILGARLFLSQLSESDRSPDRIKPSVVGGIGITFKANRRKCYVEFYNNGTVYVLFSDGYTEPETCQVPPTAQSYKVLIKAIQGYLNAGHP